MRHAFKGKEYGFFFHFLGPTFPKKEEDIDWWNRYVDSLDLAKLARQLHELHAGYAFITLGQCGPYYCSPNSVYSRVIGPDRCSRRDVMLEFAQELAKYGIDCYAYSTAMAATADLDAVLKSKELPPWQMYVHAKPYPEIKHLAGTDPRLKEFQIFWNEVHREWSLRWGKMVKGWWIDGCYYADKMYDFPDEPNGHSFCAALRAGNPDAVIGMNPGVMTPGRDYPGSDEDFTAGENDIPDADILCGEFLEPGLRYHILTSRLLFWYTPQRIAEHVRAIVDNGGVISMNTPFTVNGISDENFAKYKEFVRIYEENRAKLPATRVHANPPAADKEGSLEIQCKVPAQLVCEWGGKEYPMTAPGTIPLPYFKGGEQMLKIHHGNMLKTYRLFCGNPEYKLPFTIGSAVSHWEISHSNGKLKFHAEIHEPAGPFFHEFFWASSGAEIFIQSEAKEDSQYYVGPDGKFMQVFLVGAPIMQEGLVLTKTADGYQADFELPCPKGKYFLIEIAEHVTNPDHILKTEMLFGGAQSGYGKQKYYGRALL